MMRLMNVLMALWAVSTVECFGPNIVPSFSLRKLSTLNAGLAVGDAVIAEVDDILGSVSDPKVSFLVSTVQSFEGNSISISILAPHRYHPQT